MKSRYELLLGLQDELAQLPADPRYARLRQLADELRQADWAENQGAGGVINELSSMFLENIYEVKTEEEIKQRDYQLSTIITPLQAVHLQWLFHELEFKATKVAGDLADLAQTIDPIELKRLIPELPDQLVANHLAALNKNQIKSGDKMRKRFYFEVKALWLAQPWKLSPERGQLEAFCKQTIELYPVALDTLRNTWIRDWRLELRK
jgi:hypothetical protein